MKHNKPSPDGYAIGEHLARLADDSEVRWLADIGLAPVRCHTCAFRSGSYPNGCLPTIVQALQCVMENDPFMCHEFPGWRDGSGEPTAVCAGHILTVGCALPESLIDRCRSFANHVEVGT